MVDHMGGLVQHQENTQLKLIPVFHSNIPFYCSIPLIPDSLHNVQTEEKVAAVPHREAQLSACCVVT